MRYLKKSKSERNLRFLGDMSLELAGNFFYLLSELIYT